MQLNSFAFLALLAACCLLFHLLKGRGGWLLLLGASALFLATQRQFVGFIVLPFVAVAGFGFGLALAGQRGHRRLALVAAGTTANLVALGLFKYGVMKSVGPWQFAAVVGVSYYVFQAQAYLFDVYYGLAEPEKRFGRFALYLAFFPKYLQGPIERAGNLIPQFDQPYVFDAVLMREGCMLFVWGAMKKAVVADHLGPVVDGLYTDPSSLVGPTALAAAVLFTLQLYADFSGYTDMALGAARLFNIRLSPNFDHPFVSTTIKEFWRRWHMTLSAWVLDYVFQPCQVAFRYWGAWGNALALMIAFLLVGVWHDASACFAIFGFLQGLYMVAGTLYAPHKKRLWKAFGHGDSWWVAAWRRFFVFCLITFSLVFFRAGSMRVALAVMQGWFRWGHTSCQGWLRQGQAHLAIAAGGVALMVLVWRLDGRVRIHARPWWVRWGVYAALLALIACAGVFNGEKRFIYAQF